MEPTLHSGQSCVIIEDYNKYCAGDIICFERNGIKIIHRLVICTLKYGQMLLVEKGDNYPIATLLEMEQVFGKALTQLDQKYIDNTKNSSIIFLFALLIRLFRNVENCLFLIGFKKTAFICRYAYVVVMPSVLFVHEDSLLNKIKNLKSYYFVYKKDIRRFELLKIFSKG